MNAAVALFCSWMSTEPDLHEDMDRKEASVYYPNPAKVRRSLFVFCTFEMCTYSLFYVLLLVSDASAEAVPLGRRAFLVVIALFMVYGYLYFRATTG